MEACNNRRSHFWGASMKGSYCACRLILGPAISGNYHTGFYVSLSLHRLHYDFYTCNVVKHRRR